MIVGPVKQGIRLEIQMLGGFNLSIAGKPLSDKTERSRQVLSLLAFLLVRRFDYTSQERLIEVLWPDENSENPANALKNLVYRLRRVLDKNEQLKDQECILHSGGTYSWNRDIECSVDAEEMDFLSRSAQNENKLIGERIDLYLKALSLYKGRFLADLCYEEWVAPLSTYYQNIFLRCIHEVVRLLSQEGRYQEIINICEQAVSFEPYEEAIHEMLLKALVNLGKKNKALEYYDYISKKFYKDLGVKLSPSIQDIHREMLKSLNHVETDLSLIKDELIEINQGQGAFFCDYEIFKHLYRLEIRTAERAGQSVFICLITLSNQNNTLPAKELLLKSMETLKSVTLSCLRKGDVVSRFSAAQYILMLPTTSYENGEMVLGRIINRFKKANRNPGIRANVTLEPVFTAM